MATLILSDDFDRADTVVGAAGSTTGLGNGWIDKAGGSWQILDGQAVHSGGGGIAGPFGSPALCPGTESVAALLVSSVFECPIPGTSYDAAVEVRVQSDGSCYRAVVSEVYGLRIYKAGVGGASPEALISEPGVFVGGSRYRVSLAAKASVGGSTDLEARAAAEATPNTTLAVATISDGTAGLQTAGWGTLNGEFYAAVPHPFDEFQAYDFSDGTWPTFGTTAITAGSIAYGSATTSAITITSLTAPSGGTAPITYTWHRSQTSGFSPGVDNLIAGQTSAGLTAYAAGVGFWYYKRRATDAASATADSNQVAAKTLAAAADVVLGVIADSIFAQAPSDGSSTLKIPEIMAIILGHAAGYDREVIIVNRAIGGTTTGDWVPGAGTGYFEGAVAEFVEAGVTHVLNTLGANNSANILATTAETYGTHQAAIGAGLDAYGIKMVLNYPIYIKPGSLGGVFGEGSPARLQSYQGAIDALVNGSTVLQGDTQAFVEFSRHAEPTGEKWYIGDTVTGANPDGDDWVHPNARGVYALAAFQCLPIVSLFGLGGTTGETATVTLTTLTVTAVTSATRFTATGAANTAAGAYSPIPATATTPISYRLLRWLTGDNAEEDSVLLIDRGGGDYEVTQAPRGGAIGVGDTAAVV